MTSIIKSVGLIAKPRSDRGAELLPQLTEWLEAHGVAVFLDEGAADYAGRLPGLSRDQVAAIQWKDESR